MKNLSKIRENTILLEIYFTKKGVEVKMFLSSSKPMNSSFFIPTNKIKLV